MTKKCFKLIVAGSREFEDYDSLALRADEFIAEHAVGLEAVIISGRARGADRLGERFARDRGYRLMFFPADWDTYGPAAGPIRNSEMVKIADGLIAFWDGRSRGTKDCLKRASDKNIPVEVVSF